MIPGVGSTNGTFFISGVPAGNYWLWWNGGTQMFWTSSSTFDYGSDYIGRILSWTNFVSTTLNYNLSGLDPWNGNDSLMLNAPNVNLWENDTQVAPNPGDTAYDQTDPSPVSIQPVAAAWGDVLYVGQLEPATLNDTQFSGTLLGPALSFSSVTMLSMGTTNLSLNLAWSNPLSMEAKVSGSTWASAFADAGPGGSAALTATGLTASVGVQPFVINLKAATTADLASISASPAAPSDNAALLTDLDEGPIQFNSPFPSPSLTVTHAEMQASVAIPAPSGQSYSGNACCAVANGYEITSAPTGVFAAQMQLVGNPQINGASFYSSASLSGDQVDLSWTAPAGSLPAYGYDVTVLAWSSVYGQYATVADLYTSATSVTVPPWLLTPGNTYVFNIRAWASGRGNIASSPWRRGFPLGWADVVSAPISF